jgi:hypothetical protein
MLNILQFYMSIHLLYVNTTLSWLFAYDIKLCYVILFFIKNRLKSVVIDRVLLDLSITAIQHILGHDT